MSLDWATEKSLEERYLIYRDKGYSPAEAERKARSDIFDRLVEHITQDVVSWTPEEHLKKTIKESFDEYILYT